MLIDLFIIQELFYFFFVVTMTLIMPLVVMLVSYITIITMIYKRSCNAHIYGGTLSNQGVIGKARIQTKKVTGVLVLGFVLCWAPYYGMTFW